MPTYDYVCDACSHEWEVFQSISADKITTCPNCKEERARRKIGAGAGLIFKGSGFYVTDYKGGGRTSSDAPKSESSDAKPSADGESKSGGESKPAPSSDSTSASTNASSNASSNSDAKPTTTATKSDTK